MPLVPVPRWRPATRYNVTRRYLDALPQGWRLPVIPERGSFYGKFRHFSGEVIAAYLEHTCTAEEQAANCILSYGPPSNLGIWRPVPVAQWNQFDSTKLCLVQAHRMNENALDPYLLPNDPPFWRYPEFYEGSYGGGPRKERRPVRVDWHTIGIQEEIISGNGPRTLSERFTALNVAFDEMEAPTPQVPEPNEQAILKQVLKGFGRSIYDFAPYAGNLIYLRDEVKRRCRDAGKEVNQALDEARQTLREEARERVIKTFRRGAGPYGDATDWDKKYIQGTYAFEVGPLSAAIGYPKSNEGSTLSLVAGENATVGALGETCFECDRRDIHAVWVHVRNGPPLPNS